MANSKTNLDKLWIGFGVLTVLAGIYLIISKDYLIGISGSIVGVFLIYLNMQQIKKKQSD